MVDKRTVGPMPAAGKYVIINDCDAPQPKMVCQWVPGVGYCYLDRSDRNRKSRHDGMSGGEATSVAEFGWCWAEDEDGGSWVRFYRTALPSVAKYHDGAPRRWQSEGDYFEFIRLTSVRRRIVVATPPQPDREAR